MQRVVSVGVPVGIAVGALVTADSGMLLAGVAAFVAIGAGCGVLTARRMTKYWPGARELTGPERVAVVDAARRGDRIGETGLAPAVSDYRDGLRRAREQALPYRWIAWLLMAVALVLAVVDTVTAPVPSAVVSWLYVAIFAVELFWWPGRQHMLLCNADQAVQLAHQDS